MRAKWQYLGSKTHHLVSLKPIRIVGPSVGPRTGTLKKTATENSSSERIGLPYEKRARPLSFASMSTVRAITTISAARVSTRKTQSSERGVRFRFTVATSGLENRASRSHREGRRCGLDCPNPDRGRRRFCPTKSRQISLQRMSLWYGNVGLLLQLDQKSAENRDIFCLNGGAEGQPTSHHKCLLL